MADKNGFNISKMENLRQVFGTNWLKAFLPINTSTIDGIDYSQLIRIRIKNYTEVDKPKINIIDKGYDYSKTFSSYIFDKIRFGASTENDVEYEKSIYLGETFQMSPDVANHKQIVKLDDTFDLNDPTKVHKYNTVNSVKTIIKKHPSITFASLFKQEEERMEELGVEKYVKNNNNNQSILDGVQFPASIKQSVTASVNMTNNLGVDSHTNLINERTHFNHIRIPLED